jgi:RimJ/RimL family protein N-acetyltransferase
MRPAIVLEPFSEADFERLIAWTPTAEFLLQWAGPIFSFPLDRSQLAAHLALARQKPITLLSFRGTDATKGEPIGHIEIAKIDQRNQSGTLSRVLLGPGECRGRGLGQQLVRSALSVAFNELKLHRVDLFVYEFNKTAISCYKRVGFQHEGVLRQAVRYGDTYWNACLMSILESEWRASHASST